MVVLPSSPVWYQSRGTDTSRCGILAFASRNLIFLIDLTKQRLEIYGILKGHSEKVTSCSFLSASKQKSMLLLVTGADDCSVKVWNAEQKLCLQEHMSHGTNKVVSVHWSPVDPSLIVSGDEKGYVICWYTDTNLTDRYCPDGTSQMQLCCLTCSPHQANLVAVGYKSGAVSVMDISKHGMVIRKMRGHSNEVHAIVWSPHREDEPSSDLSEESLSDCQDKREPFGLLVTGSKDKTIRMWNVSKGKCLKVYKLPNRQYKGRRSSEDVARIYVTLYWPLCFKDRFISSGFNGDIIIWNLSPTEECDFEILAAGAHDSGHQRIIFNMCQGSTVSNTLVTTSMDRQILHWTIPEARSGAVCNGPDWSLPTLGGFIYAVAVPSKEPTIVAIGVGDGMIRIWKTKNPRSAYDITTLWQGIKEKVMALSWHPTKTGILAFGTEDGKVGIYDTLAQQHPVIAETYHLKSVYVLSWGPRCYAKCDAEKSEVFFLDKEKFFLFSSGGEGLILQHNPVKMSNDARNIDKIIADSNANHLPGRHSAIEWTLDGTLAAIGNDNGSINIYTAPHLIHIVDIKSHSKIINCIRWKPPMEGESEDPLQIASGSNNSILHIHDLKKIFHDNKYVLGNKLETAISISKPYRSLVGHLCRITGISYNPLNTNQIVSASYDGTAQVWEISTEKPLFNFRDHCGRLLSIVWSSVHDDDSDATKHKTGIIYSGADDYTVHGWYCENQQHNEPYKNLPDFAAGSKNKFQGKKRGKKNKQTVAPQLPEETNCFFQDHSRSNPVPADPNDLLHQKKKELLAALGAGDMAGLGKVKPCTEETKTNYSIKKSSEGAKVTPSKVDGFNSSSFKIFQNNSETCSPLCHPTVETWKNNKAEGEITPRKRKRIKSFFQFSINLDNRKKSDQHQDCVKIAQYKMHREDEDDLSFLPGDEKHINLGFYTDRNAAFRMMKIESKKMRDNDNVEGMSFLRMWTGDVVGAIEEATEKEQLTDQLVAMAPMAGNEFWRKTAYAFAKQLVKEEHYLHAVHYMLVCDKVYEAIDVLAENRHYREAVSLARARLCDDDPLLVKTVQLWAKKLKSGGSVELAAKCFASISDFHSACECLAQRASSGISTLTDSDVSSLFAAASVAFTTKDVTSGRSYANRAMNTICLRTWNWCDAHEYLSGFRNLSLYSAILIAHEYIITRLEAKTKHMEKMTTMKKSNWNNSMIYCIQGVNKSFPESFLDIWKGQTPTDSQAIHTEALNQGMEENVTVLHVLYQVALSLSAGIVASPLLLPWRHQINDDVQPELVNVNSNTSSNIHECNLTRDSWIKHIDHALQISISSEKQLTSKGVDEIFAMACEIISCVESVSGLYSTESFAIIKPLRTLCLNEIESKRADVKDKCHRTAAMLQRSGARFLLEKINQNREEKLNSYLQKQLIE